MRDVLAGVDALVADGLADPERLGVTGGSYGGYLTNWIVGHDDRFRAAMTCRCVSDMSMLFLTGDISGGDWATARVRGHAVERPGLLPRDLADHLRGADPDAAAHPARGDATSARRSARPRRCSRSCAPPAAGPPAARAGGDPRADPLRARPFRRVENLQIVLGWFRHFLVEARSGMPPLPAVRGGR